ncbi:DUF2180 family protein [Amycolatopsis sp. NPDC051102]|uniref:DUF2180 family protein n=1 Tax=Amycolatopsis sp. NPDC051102 TaxID=3155163 RepID=UPI003438A7AC
MRCLDCASNSDDLPAIGVCTTCGAGVCESCVRIGHQSIRDLAGLAPMDGSIIETRKLACLPCATALGAHHAGRYHFAAPAGHGPGNR